MQQDLSLVNKKMHLMMLNQGSYKLYPADNMMFRVKITII